MSTVGPWSDPAFANVGAVGGPWSDPARVLLPAPALFLVTEGGLLPLDLTTPEA